MESTVLIIPIMAFELCVILEEGAIFDKTGGQKEHSKKRE